MQDSTKSEKTTLSSLTGSFKKHFNARAVRSKLKSLKEKFNTRAASAFTFMASDIFFLLSNSANLMSPHGKAAIAFIACAICLKLSEKNPRWLYPAGTSLIAGHSIISISAKGAGQLTQRIGTALPLTQGCLLLRSAYQQANNKSHFKTDKAFLKPFEYIDKYPIFSAGIVEAPGVALLAVGAFVSGENNLGIVAVGWTIGNIFLGASDPKFTEISTAVKTKVAELKHRLL